MLLESRKVPVPEGIAKVVYSENIEGPAMGNLRTRIVTLKPSEIAALNDDQLYYVLCHEAGHIVQQTRSEDLADEYASKVYLASKRSPKQSVFALSDVLPHFTQEHHYKPRVINQLCRAASYDYKVNNNKNALKILDMCETKFIADSTLDEFEANYIGDPDDTSLLGINLGLTKAARQRKQDSHNMKMETKASKNYRRNNNADVKRMRAENGEEGTGSKIMGTLGQLGGAAASVFAGIKGLKTGEAGGAAYSEEGAQAASGGDGGSTPTKSDKILGMEKTTFYIVAGVTAAVVIAVGCYLAFGGKKNG